MTHLEQKIKELVSAGRWQVTMHGQRKLQERQLILSEIVAATGMARLVEEYPGYHHGPAALFLLALAPDLAVHVIWGISKAETNTAYLVTAYVPDAMEWEPDQMTRRST